MAYSKQEKESYIKQQYDSLKNTLQMALESYQEHPEQIAEAIAFKAKFYQYSVRNSILIQHQNPNSTYVASYKKWKELGYSVKRNEHALKILVPVIVKYFEHGVAAEGKPSLKKLTDATTEEKVLIKNGRLPVVERTIFRMGNVFDIAQTTCPPEEYPKIYHPGYQSEQHAVLYRAMRQFAEDAYGITVSEADLQSISVRGDYALYGNAIRTNKILNDTQKLDTFTHEFGHAIMVGADPDVPDVVKELEADAVSIMMQTQMGIELTQARIDHFKSHYEMCSQTQSFQIEALLDKVSRAYVELRDQMDVVIEKAVEESQQLSQELQQNRAKSVDTEKESQNQIVQAEVAAEQREEEKKEENEDLEVAAAVGIAATSVAADQAANHFKHPFSEQVDAVLAGHESDNNALYVCTTPEVLLKIGLKQLPMLMTPHHLKNIVHAKSSENSSWHGLDVGIVKQMPNLISEPAIILKSATQKTDIVLVTNHLDAEHMPIIVTVHPDGQGRYQLQQVDSNFITSVYGKNRFLSIDKDGIPTSDSFLGRAIEEKRVLFWDKEKSRTLIGELGLQLSEAFMNADSIYTPIISTNSEKSNLLPEQKSGMNSVLKDAVPSDPAKQRIFVDMDGTLTKFFRDATMENLSEPGFFSHLPAHVEMVNAVGQLVQDARYEVFILSSALQTQTAVPEKQVWLDKNLPVIDYAHRLFPKHGTDKALSVPGGVRKSDVLIDDYSRNLLAWPGIGIKVLNGINNRHGTWLHSTNPVQGAYVNFQTEFSLLASDIALLADTIPLLPEMLSDERKLYLNAVARMDPMQHIRADSSHALRLAFQEMMESRQYYPVKLAALADNVTKAIFYEPFQSREAYQSSVSEESREVLQKAITAANSEKMAKTVKQETKTRLDVRQHANHMNFITQRLNILDIAQDMGLTLVKEGMFYGVQEDKTIVLDAATNSFARFSEFAPSGGIFGGNNIDFVLQAAQMRPSGRNIHTRSDAINWLIDQYAVTDETIHLPDEGKPQKASAYLNRYRHITKEVIAECVERHLLYEDQQHNLVFVGKGKDGNVQFAAQHTTLPGSDYKRETAGNEHNTGWYVDNNADKVYVTISPIDVMSVMSLRQQAGEDVQDANYLALMHLSKTSVLDKCLSEHSEIKEVVMAFGSNHTAKAVMHSTVGHLQQAAPDIKLDEYRLSVPNMGMNAFLVRKSNEKRNPVREVQQKEQKAKQREQVLEPAI